MTRKEVKELLPIIQAYANGEEIEIKTKEGVRWSTLEEDDIQYLDFKKCDFRIKSEPKYRPFNNSEECWEEMQKHQPFGWVKNGKFIYNIINIRTDGIIINNGIDNSWYRFKYSFNFTFIDGTPFGIKDYENEKENI